MKRFFWTCATKHEGFSLIELLTVMTIMGILVSLALPSFFDWRKNYYYRQASSEISGILRDARGRAISTNLQHRVEFEISGKRYRLTKGNRAYNTPDDASNWTVEREWAILPSEVAIAVTPASLKITFNANGSAIAGSVDIKDTAGNPKFQITIAATGRIKSAKNS